MVIFNRIGLVNIGRVGSVGVTVSITIERYLSICHPNNGYAGKSLLLPLPIAFAILYNIPKFFELLACEDEYMKGQNSNETHLANSAENHTVNNVIETHYNSSRVQQCTPEGLQATPMRQNPWYIIFYSVLSKLLLVEIIPWITVIVLNYFIWKKIREFHAKRELILRSGPNQGINRFLNITSRIIYLLL